MTEHKCEHEYGDFERGKEIGSGSTHVVTLNTYKGKVYALKESKADRIEYDNFENLKSRDTNTHPRLRTEKNGEEFDRFLVHCSYWEDLSRKAPTAVATLFDYNDYPTRWALCEYSNGGNLSQTLVGSAEEEMTVEEKVSLFAMLLRQLQKIHDAGYLHLDLKPGNIMKFGDNWKLIDFDNCFPKGEAKKLESTPKYAAPEQSQGNPNELSERTDIYQMGKVLMEILSGDTKVSSSDDFWEALKVPDIYKPMLRKALDRDPGARYASAKDFAEDLEAAIKKQSGTGFEQGMRYYKGLNSTPNIEKAKKIFEKDASVNSAIMLSIIEYQKNPTGRADSMLASRLGRDIAIPKDLSGDEAWMYGFLCEHGIVVDKDEDKARELYEAAKDSPLGNYQLYLMSGRDTSYARYLEMAAMAGYAPAYEYCYDIYKYRKDEAQASRMLDKIADFCDMKVIAEKDGWLYAMRYNDEQFNVDTKQCLSYVRGYDCGNFTPVSGSSKALKVCNPGSWDMTSGADMANDMLKRCFYATFDDRGMLHQKLDPRDLTNVIAVWDRERHEWDYNLKETDEKDNVVSARKDENTMFCIPTMFFDYDSKKGLIILSNDPSVGTAFAHTCGDHTYRYLAIGVYGGSISSDGRLMSLSGVKSASNHSLAEFRDMASKNIVQKGKAMLWNFYQWNLWRQMVFFACRSFDAIGTIGYGGLPFDTEAVHGICERRGVFVGSSIRGSSEETSVKAFIENPWGHMEEFLDDTLNSRGYLLAGQNPQPSDNKDQMDDLGYFGFDGNPTTISLDPKSWGIGLSGEGLDDRGLCNYQRLKTDKECRVVVGGTSEDVAPSDAGPSYINATYSMEVSEPWIGARLAFVFDPRGGWPVTGRST